MRLINCPQCGTRCSDQEKKCPECGFELDTFFAIQKVTSKKPINRRTAIYVGIICFLLFALIFAFTRTEKQRNNNLHTVEEVSKETYSKPQPLIINDSGYSRYSYNGKSFLTYAILIHNPNTDYNIRFPEIRIALRDDSGQLIDTKREMLSCIAAEDTIWYGDYFEVSGPFPDQVEFSLEYPNYGPISIDKEDFVRADELEVFSISAKSESLKTYYIGEIRNNSDIDLDSAWISIIFFKDNTPVAGTSTVASYIHPGGSSSFKTDTFNFHAFDEYVAFAHD